MDVNCAPLVVDLFLFCYDRDFIMSLLGDKEAEIIKAINATSRYSDGLLNMDDAYVDFKIYHRISCRQAVILPKSRIK